MKNWSRLFDGLNMKLNLAVKDLVGTKKIVSAFNDQLTTREEKKKSLELERDNLLKEKKLVEKATSKLHEQLANFGKEKEKTSVEHTLQMQQAFIMGHEDGFQKALCQIQLLAFEVDLMLFDCLKNVKNGELVRESQMETFEEASGNETTSKEEDIEATSSLTLTSNIPTA